MVDAAPGQNLQPVKESRGLGATVGLHQSDRHIHTFSLLAGCRNQHFGGFTHARRHAEIDLQPPPLSPIGFSEQGVWIGSAVVWVGVHFGEGLSRHGTKTLIQCEVGFKHIYPRFADHAEKPAPNMTFDEASHSPGCRVACFSDPVDLQPRKFR